MKLSDPFFDLLRHNDWKNSICTLPRFFFFGLVSFQRFSFLSDYIKPFSTAPLCYFSFQPRFFLKSKKKTTSSSSHQIRSFDVQCCLILFSFILFFSLVDSFTPLGVFYVESVSLLFELNSQSDLMRSDLFVWSLALLGRHNDLILCRVIYISLSALRFYFFYVYEMFIWFDFINKKERNVTVKEKKNGSVSQTDYYIKYTQNAS